MKVVKLFSIVLVSSFLVASSVFATDNDKSNADVKASENVIREQVAGALSKVTIENSDVVYVYFSVSSKGFVLTDVTGINADLTETVKRTLSSATIATPSNLDGKYLLKVKFIDGSSF